MRLRLGEVSASAWAEAGKGYATAHSGRVDQVGAGAAAAAMRLSMREAAPGRSQRLRPGGGEDAGTQQPTPVASTRSVPAGLQRRCGCPCVRLRLVEVSASAWAEARVGYATAHSDHALRQVTLPFVPMPSSARMAAPRAMRSRRSSPVRCSPAAALRMPPAIASMTARAAPPPRPRGDGYTVTVQPRSARRSCASARPNSNPNFAGPVPAPPPTRGLEIPVRRRRCQIEIYYLQSIVCSGRM